MIPPAASAPVADSCADGVLSFWIGELPEPIRIPLFVVSREVGAADGSSGPDVLQPATRISETTMENANRRIWASGNGVDGVVGGPKMRLPPVHLQHTGSLK